MKLTYKDGMYRATIKLIYSKNLKNTMCETIQLQALGYKSICYLLWNTFPCHKGGEKQTFEVKAVHTSSSMLYIHQKLSTIRNRSTLQEKEYLSYILQNTFLITAHSLTAFSMDNIILLFAIISSHNKQNLMGTFFIWQC